MIGWVTRHMLPHLSGVTHLNVNTSLQLRLFPAPRRFSRNFSDPLSPLTWNLEQAKLNTFLGI